MVLLVRYTNFAVLVFTPISFGAGVEVGSGVDVAGAAVGAAVGTGVGVTSTVSFEELPHPAALNAAAAASAIIIFLYFIIITSRITVYTYLRK